LTNTLKLCIITKSNQILPNYFFISLYRGFYAKNLQNHFLEYWLAVGYALIFFSYCKRGFVMFKNFFVSKIGITFISQDTFAELSVIKIAEFEFDSNSDVLGSAYISKSFDFVVFELGGKFYKVLFIDLLNSCIVNHFGG